MDRATFKLLVAIGALLFGALFLLSVVAAAIAFARPVAAYLAIAAAGASYLNYVCHYIDDDGAPVPAGAWAQLLFWIALLLGVVAWLALMW